MSETIEQGMLTRLAQMKNQAFEEGQRYLEADKRATYSLDNQIDKYKSYENRLHENIEHAYSSIEANLIAIRKWEIESESMNRFITLLETFREDLQNGVDVTEEYEPFVHNPSEIFETAGNLEPNEGQVENVLKARSPKEVGKAFAEMEDVKTNPQRKTAGRRAAKPKGEE